MAARWWRERDEEVFWLESTDREDIGSDLKAPLVDASGRPNWRYTLFRDARNGDTVFHYDKRVSAIVGLSRISGAAEFAPITWAARGSYARERGAEPSEVDGYRIPLTSFRLLDKPLQLDEIRQAEEVVRSVYDALPKGGARYFPFELSRRAIRPLQGYAFKLPAAFVEAFPSLRAASAAPAWASGEEPISSRIAYMIAMLNILRDAGGQLRSTDVFERIRSGDVARKADLETLQPSGETRFVKEVRFARLELVKAGLVEQGEPGSWSLSTAGWSSFLTPAEAQALVTLRRRGRLEEIDRSSITGGPTTGPRPTSYTAMISRTVAAQSWLYLLRFGESDVWKVGHAQDLDSRLAAINRHIPTELLGMRWAIFARKPCRDSLAAYGLEQNILTDLRICRTEGERVRCPRDRIIEAWRSACAAQEIISPDR